MNDMTERGGKEWSLKQSISCTLNYLKSLLQQQPEKYSCKNSLLRRSEMRSGWTGLKKLRCANCLAHLVVVCGNLAMD